MKRKVIDNLKMQNNELVCKEKTGHYKNVFKKQGCLDGACATYSVIMNLLILGVITEKDTQVNVEHKSRETKKLFKIFCNDYGMHRNGQTFFKIKRMLNKSLSSITTTHKNTNGKQSVDVIKETIDNKIPIVISVSDNSEWGHAMLAIGYEINEKNEVLKILCLDPSGNYIHGRKRWNAEVIITSKRFKLQTDWSGLPIRKYVNLEDVLIIEKNDYEE